MVFSLVTGASKGIGLEIATALAKRNRNLVLVARSEALLKTLAETLSATCHVQVRTFACDLADTESPQLLYNWCEAQGIQIDFLVNNAGYGLVGKFEDQPLAETLDMAQLNMLTLTQLCHVFLPMLHGVPRGYIVNIASTTAYQAMPMMAVYAATKSYVLQFSRGLHQELRGSNVSVTAVSPGATTTHFNDRANLGEKARKQAEKVTMPASVVAEMAVEAALAGKAEVITGFLNKIGAVMAWLMPKSLVERAIMKIYG